MRLAGLFSLLHSKRLMQADSKSLAKCLRVGVDSEFYLYLFDLIKSISCKSKTLPQLAISPELTEALTSTILSKVLSNYYAALKVALEGGEEADCEKVQADFIAYKVRKFASTDNKLVDAVAPLIENQRVAEVCRAALATQDSRHSFTTLEKHLVAAQEPFLKAADVEWHLLELLKQRLNDALQPSLFVDAPKTEGSAAKLSLRELLAAKKAGQIC